MEAPEGNEFNFVNGTQARDVNSFLSQLKELSPEEFSAHFNESRNDFYNWMKDCVNGDIAEDIKAVKSQRELVEKLTGHHWQYEHKKKHNY